MPAAAAGLTAGKIFWTAVEIAFLYGMYAYEQDRLEDALNVGTSVDLRQSRRSGNEPWRIIYGEAKVGCVYVFAGQTGLGRKWLHLVAVVAAHPVESLGDGIWIDNDWIELDGNGEPIDSGISAQYRGAFYCQKLLGDHTETWSDLVTEFASKNVKWTADHKLLGHACVWIKFDLEHSRFQGGVPNFQFDVQGHSNVYDPRSGGSYGYTTNAALCLADYLANTRYGVGGGYAEIDEDDAIAAANIADEDMALDGGGTEKRYTCNGVLTCAATRGENITKLLTAMNGVLPYTDGKWRILPAAWRAPTLSFDENDLAGEVRTQTRMSRRDLFNCVKGTFVNKDQDNFPTDFPAYKNSTYITEDGGEEVYHEMELPLTNSSPTAQRLAKMHLERIRQQITLEWPGKLYCYKAQVGDVVQITLERFGWTSKEFEVVDVKLDFGEEEAGLICHLTLRETAEAVYTWSAEETTIDLADDTDLTNINVQDPATNLVLLSDETTALWITPTNIQPRVKVTFDEPDDASVVKHYEVQYKVDSDSVWTATPRLPKGTAEVFIPGVSVGLTYDVRVRAVNFYGVVSDWVEDSIEIEALDISGSGLNMLYSGGLRHSRDWRVTEPTPTPKLPDDHTGSTYDDPGNSYDDDDDTYAEAAVSGGGANKYLELTGFGTGAEADSGYISVLSDADVNRGGAVGFLRNYDAVGWQYWGADQGRTLGSPAWIHSDIFDIADLSTLVFKCSTSATGSSASAAHRAHEVVFNSVSVGAFGHVQQHLGTLQGTVGTDGEIWRRFPGRNPVDNVILLQIGKHVVVQLYAWANEAPDADLELVLHDLETDTESVVMIVPYGEISTTDVYAFAGRFTAQSDMIGSWEFHVRTNSTKKIFLTRMMVSRGSLIHPWAPNNEEQGYSGEQPYGEPGSWPPGPWVDDAGGRSVVKKVLVS